MKNKQSGFTLIEIAIVLVIIGLLLGGILKGQELINSAKVKNLATDFKNTPVYIYGYQDKYRALPGDQTQTALDAQFPASGVTASSTTGTLANGVINGNWNATTVASESFVFWQHIRLAGLAPGPTSTGDTNYIPRNSEGGVMGIQSGTNVPASSPVIDSAGNAIRGTYVICSAGILGKFVKQLDATLDDNSTNTGSLLATPTTGYAIGAASTASASIDEAATYTVCMGI